MTVFPPSLPRTHSGRGKYSSPDCNADAAFRLTVVMSAWQTLAGGYGIDSCQKKRGKNKKSKKNEDRVGCCFRDM